MGGEAIRVVVADDHQLFRQSLVTSLETADEVVVVGQAADAEGAFRLVRDEVPDVVLLDSTLSGGGLPAARRLALACPASRIIVLTVSEDEEELLAFVAAGASGYVLKGAAAEELTGLVRSVDAGELAIGSSLAFGLLNELSRLGTADPRADLSAGEREVLELMASGLSHQQVALKLGLAQARIKHHVANIVRRFQVRRQVEAALLAAEAEAQREEDGGR